jgi:polyisoprenoid-binding protein YceI
MKSNHLTIAFTILLLATAAALSAASLTHFERQPGSKVKIDGVSSLHDWTVESAIIGGHLDIDSTFIADPQKATAGSKIPAEVEALVPVRSLKSGKDLMNNVMYETMNQKDHPQIAYHLKELTLKEAPKSANGPFQFDSVGSLVINGVTNDIKMPVTIEKLDSSKLKTIGSANLKMTSFGIKPPAPKIGLGLLTTKDDIKVTFEWLTAQTATASTK